MLAVLGTLHNRSLQRYNIIKKYSVLMHKSEEIIFSSWVTFL